MEYRLLLLVIEYLAILLGVVVLPVSVAVRGSLNLGSSEVVLSSTIPEKSFFY